MQTEALAKQTNRPVKIIVHHSADYSEKGQLAKINNWHKEKGFSQSATGYFIGYHYLIEKDGTTIQTRFDSEEGCHTVGQNTQSIGVCLAGNFNIERPTDKQREALITLLYQKCKKYWIPSKYILPHRTFADRDCYGTNLTDGWAQALFETEMEDSVWRFFNGLLNHYK